MENTAIDIKVAHLTWHDRMGKKPSQATVPLKNINVFGEYAVHGEYGN